MKSISLALALLTATVQTVGWVECCCVLICKHRNDPCGKCKEKHEAPPVEASCCEKKHEAPKAPAPEKRCSHVEPSSEVVAHATVLPPVILDVVLELPVVPFAPTPSQVLFSDAAFGEIRGSPPLHLLNSVLLI